MPVCSSSNLLTEAPEDDLALYRSYQASADLSNWNLIFRDTAYALCLMSEGVRMNEHERDLSCLYLPDRYPPLDRATHEPALRAAEVVRQCRSSHRSNVSNCGRSFRTE